MQEALSLQDLNFYGSPYSSKYGLSKFIRWDRSLERRGVSVFTDLCLSLSSLPQYKNTKKIAWILEPLAINPAPYEFIRNNHNLFSIVLSHNLDLIKSTPNAKYIPNAMFWVNGCRDQEKTKDISIIASHKKSTTGHRFRHEIIKFFSGSIDVFGSGYRFIQDKDEALCPYRFSIVVENCQEKGYDSEKIRDCFLTKTVPIYWGNQLISQSFDNKGIIEFNSIEELKIIISNIKKDPLEYYQSMYHGIENNYDLVKNMKIAEDYLWEQIQFDR